MEATLISIGILVGMVAMVPWIAIAYKEGKKAITEPKINENQYQIEYLNYRKMKFDAYLQLKRAEYQRKSE